MNLQIYTDGGSKGNPGPASIGVYMKSGNTTVLKYREDIGVTTNNVAEYTAVIRALEKIPTLECFPRITKLDFFADSLLVVEQLKGKWKIKEPHLASLAKTAHENLSSLTLPHSFTHVRRELNKVADDLVNGIM